MRPSADANVARLAAARLYGLSGPIVPLPGYDDANFLIRTAAGSYVLKIGPPGADPRPVHFQSALLEFLRSCQLPFRVPEIRPTRQDETAGWVEDDTGRTRIVRLLTWIPGTFLAQVTEPSNRLLESIGASLARLDQALEGFGHPEMNRVLSWDLLQAGRLREDIAAIPRTDRRDIVRRGLDRFEEAILPILKTLPASVIHNDANEHNVLVTSSGSDGEMGGLIDFGDAVRTARVIEPAVAATYALMLRKDGEEASAAVLAGYDSVLPFDEASLSILPELIRTRLCVSVIHSARATAARGEDAYVTVSEAGAWRQLERMGEEGWRRVSERLIQGVRPS